jgi:sigma-B regulation protein RsbU (phosphoserine phosphatase)
MNDRQITFATSGNFEQPVKRFLSPVLEHWPDVVPPDSRSVLLDVLLHELEVEGETEPGAMAGSALVAVGASTPASLVDRLVEGLHRRRLPGIVLSPGAMDWQGFQRHGVIFQPLDTDPRRLAAMLYALCERQGVVRLLDHEIHLANRCQGGIRVQIDRIHEELNLAAAIQREFTSGPVPDVPGLELGVLFRPANFVSGDIYNLRDLGNGKAAFFVADAVGHGVPAALLTMVLTSALTTAEPDEQGHLRMLEPREVLGRLNRRMCASCLGTGRFATAVYGVFDARTRTATVASAGHPAPIVLSTRNPRTVESGGALLGVFGEAEYDQSSVTLDPDESLLVYTDGLEAVVPSAGTPLSERLEWGRRLAEAARQGPRGPSFALAELQGMLDSQVGSLHQFDDVTALCIAPSRDAA